MPTLNDWAWVTAMVVQAMRGAITANYRMITLRCIDGTWRLDFFFVEDDPADRRVAGEIREDLAASLDDIRGHLTRGARLHVDHGVAAGMGVLPLDPSPNLRIVYLRDELRR